MIYVRRASGLLQSFDPPELTIEAAIGRGWQHRPEGGLLLEPKSSDPWLKTYPLPGWEHAWDEQSWSDAFIYTEMPWGPL